MPTKLPNPERIQPIPEVLPTPDVPINPYTGKPREKRFVTILRAEKWWIDKARIDPTFFIHYVSGLEPARHHRLWIRNIFDFSQEGKEQNKFRLNLIAPRDSAKSTEVMYSMAWFMARFPLTTNMIISVSAKQAESRLEMIRDIMHNNARFRNVFPWIDVDERQRNTIQEFSVASEGLYDEKTGKAKTIGYNAWRSMVARHGSLKDPSLYVSGSGGKGVIGRRISGMMVLDDIIDESHLRAELQDDVYDYLMRTLIPCVMDNAKVIAIGTRWMPEDLPERLKKNPGWFTIEIPAIRYNADGTAQSYWPEYWPLEKLERRRIEMDNDALFRVAYLNDPSAFASAKFTLGGLANKLPPAPFNFKSVFIGTDFAISTKKDADWTVFVAVGVDADKNLFVLDWRRLKVTPDIMVNELGSFANQIALQYGKLDMVLIEKVAFQTVMQFSMAEKYPSIPVFPLPPIGDKGHRTEQLARLCNENRVFFNQEHEVYREFKAEAMNFKVHRYDDCLDALSQIVQYLGASVQNARVRRVRSNLLL